MRARLRHWRHQVQFRWRHERQGLVVMGVVAAVIAVVVAAILLTRPAAEDPSAEAPPYVSPTGPVTLGGPVAEETPTPTPTAAADPSDPLSAFGPLATYNPQGFGGAGGTSGATPLALRITVTSSVPISFVGYQIPTSVERTTGLDREVGTSWSLSTKVYGTPDYARVFIQAGLAGTPVTCTVTVNGKVTDQRSTDGPYGLAVCQG